QRSKNVHATLTRLARNIETTLNVHRHQRCECNCDDREPIGNRHVVRPLLPRCGPNREGRYSLSALPPVSLPENAESRRAELSLWHRKGGRGLPAAPPQCVNSGIPQRLGEPFHPRRA